MAGVLTPAEQFEMQAAFAYTVALAKQSPVPKGLLARNVALAKAGGSGDQLPSFVAGGILLQPEGIALLFAITAQALGRPLGSTAELLAMEGVEGGVEDRALLKAEGVDTAQVLCPAQLAFFTEQQFGFISGALIESGVA